MFIKIICICRFPLEPGLKLAVTLRHLATGASHADLQYGFRVARNTICTFIPGVLQAIIDAFKDEYLSDERDQNRWDALARAFEERWQFPHCLGALDGKHIRIKKPPKSGSLFYNYKNFFSIVLLALVDADYKFLWVNVGAEGSASDAQIFNHSQLRDLIEGDDLGFPRPCPLPGGDVDVPYFIIGDDAFPLRPWMMKPFSRRQMAPDQQIFNYRLSRARRVVENAFGIMAMKFQIILGFLNTTPDRAEQITLACVTLHNILRTRNRDGQMNLIDQENEDSSFTPGEWRFCTQLLDGDHRGARNVTTLDGANQRNYLKDYFIGPGAVPWQEKMIWSS
ncbi:uncharacterized protein [Apostichopus japonicus]|uniref:uncharacterized protein isoform X1 n=1 Tax=Stichopus japonicus TaxID=307972 RepID=UPI003AB68B38